MSNVVVVGWCVGTVDLGGGAAPCVGLGSAFVVKLDAGGNYLWELRGQGLSTQAFTVGVDSQGEVAILGTCVGDCSFGGGVMSNRWKR